MFEMIRKALYGDLTTDEFKKFGMLSSVLLCIIGSYWLLRTVKDAIFMKTVGKLFIPYAKMTSFFVLIPLILLYSELVDRVERHKLFYIICGSYFVIFTGIALTLAHPTIGLANTVTDKYRLVGWATYLGIETFGSLVVALFWSFVASTTETSAAKKGYALIIGGAQVGSIAGPAIVSTMATTLGLPVLFGIAAFSIFLVPVLIARYVVKYPYARAEKSSSKKPTGPIEGLKLLLSKPYLMGILGIATLYEVIGTILDYQMKFLADEAYGSAEKVAEFLSLFGMAANGLALVFALIGTSFFIRRFGLTFCLVMFPTAVACVVLYVMAFPMLWALFIAMVAIKGLSYALNNPCKEIMYIPTSKDVKFKAKGWIDGFGGRSAKAAGSSVNAMFTSMTSLMFYGSIVSLGVIGVWVLVALYVGRTNKALVDNGKIIE
jgi:AAA family ATP:ADP antiporter